MKTKILVIGVVEKDGKVLMRKKPDGSPPYDETWYIFGGELNPDQTDPETAIKDIVRKQTGVEIRMKEGIYWDTEIKADLDGEVKFFIYLDAMCEYVDGEIEVGEGIEKVEWVPVEKLGEYDLVPPSRKLFERLGYLQ